MTQTMIHLTVPPPAADRSWAYFLDFDGTLVDIAPTPNAAFVSPALRTLLEAAFDRLGGALALITGRSLENLDSLVRMPFLPAAGQHGLEWRDGTGNHHALWSSPVPPDVIDSVASWSRHRPGTLVEVKGYSVALHVRNSPHHFPAAIEMMEHLVASAAAEDPGPFEIQTGDNVVEIKLAGANKGTALDRFLTLPAFAGRRPVFIGDDLTDEHAFARVLALGGIGIRVGQSARPTAAAYGLDNPAATRAWLGTLTS